MLTELASNIMLKYHKEKENWRICVLETECVSLQSFYVET